MGSGEISSSRVEPATTASRRRRKRTGSSSRRSPASVTSDRRRAGLVDGGPGQAEDEVGREAVAELRVDRVGADDALGQLGPGVGRLVGEAGAADDGHRPAAARLGGGADAGGGRGEGLAPADRHQLALLAQPRLDEAPVLEAAGLARLARGTGRG